MVVNPERGGAIMFLFIAVGLLGGLSYAFLQGSRTSTTLITSEADKATTYKSQDCTNAVNMATKRLQARGCGAMISTLEDGSNTNPGAPTDGSCSVYHPNGGGVKSCGTATLPTDPCTTGPIAAVCADGAFYIGDVGGTRIYSAASDEVGGAAYQWKTTDTATSGTTSATDGLANTDAMMAAGPTDHPAGNACKNKPPAGTWYLPARDELWLFWTNRMTIDLNSKGITTTEQWLSNYYTSTEFNVNSVKIVDFYSGGTGNGVKSQPLFRVRCVRR